MARQASKRKNDLFDIAVIGGGLAGLTLAVRLGQAGVRTACIDREDPQKRLNPRFDGRTTAIAYAVKLALEECGIWLKLGREACPILDIRVADGASPLYLEFNHSEAGDMPFGWIVENRLLTKALLQRVKSLPSVMLFAPDDMQKLDLNEDAVRLTLKSGRVIEAALALGADGRMSSSRDLAGIGIRREDYWQSAVVATIAHSKPHYNVALEHFLPAGPLAALPMTGKRSSIVWTERHETAKHIMQMSDGDFTAALEEFIGVMVGPIKLVAPRFCYPLTRLHADKYTATRFALVGEAAHVMHPIAGQGWNVSMRDIKILVEEITHAARLGLDIGNENLLRRYERRRRLDNRSMLAATDILDRLFSNAVPPLARARQMGIAAVHRLPPLKRFFMKSAMGLSKAA
jgi:2-octaprenyl-6-methoxyphenol hydroxylase